MKQRITWTWLLATGIAAFPVLAADVLNVKTGTWEATFTTNTAGVGLPASVVASMTPEQKAQAEMIMKQLAASGPKTVTERSCVTDKDIREGAFRERIDETGCTYNPVMSSGKRQEMTFECPVQGSTMSGRMVVDAIDNANVRGEMQIKAEGMTINSTFKAKWIGPNCTNEKKD